MENQTPSENKTPSWYPYMGAAGVALIVGAFFLNLLFGLPTAILLAMGGVGVMLLAIYVVTRPRQELRQAVTGHNILGGSNAVLMIVLFIGIVIAINFIAVRQFPYRLDLTQGKQRTLSPQTVQVLQNLKEPIQVTGFFVAQSVQNEIDAENTLKDYQSASNKITYRFVDPQANPAMAASYQIVSTDPVLVFERGTRREKVFQFDENSLTNAVLKVSQDQQPAIYFTTGHGEIDPADTANTGLSGIGTGLQQNNYKVDKLNLATISASGTISGGVPADTSAIVIARPAKPFSGEEEQRLKLYLQNGGRLLLMVDPQTDPGLKDLLTSWGLQLNNDLILDPDPQFNYQGNPALLVFGNLPTHPVTQDMTGYAVLVPFGARSIGVVQGSDKTPTALFTTSSQSCAKTDFAALQNQQQLQCDPAKDNKGPFVVGYAVEGTAPAGSQRTPRLVVVGNSQFASNQALQNQGNGYIVGNMINWLAGQEQLIAIPAKATVTHQLNVTTGQDTIFIELSTIGLVPLIFIIVGGLMWWRRR
ncbi:MAG: GldG family protein [Anaerolineae bacterium]